MWKQLVESEDYSATTYIHTLISLFQMITCYLTYVTGDKNNFFLYDVALSGKNV